MNTEFPDALTLPRRLLQLRTHDRPSPPTGLRGGATAPTLSGGATTGDLSDMMDAVARAAARELDRLRANPGASIVVAWGGLEVRGDQGENSLPSDDDARLGRTRLLSFTQVRTARDAPWAALPVHWQTFVTFRP